MSWYMCKALDNRSLGGGLRVRHWTTELWVDRSWSRGKALHYVSLGRKFGYGTGLPIIGSWSRVKALDYGLLGHGLAVRHWTTDNWVKIYE